MALANELREAAYDGGSIRSGLELEAAANEARAVVHDVESHARAAPGRGSKALAVILDLQVNAVPGLADLDGDVARAAVFEGIVQGFLRDAVKMRGGRYVAAQFPGVRFAPALDLVALGGSGGQFLERGHEPLGAEPDGIEPAADAAGLGDGLVQEGADLPRGGRFRALLRGERLFQGIGAERNADQLLAQAVVNILPDARLFAVADLQRGFLGPDAHNGAGNLGRHQLDPDPRAVGNLVLLVGAQDQQPEDGSLVLDGNSRQRPQALAAP